MEITRLTKNYHSQLKNLINIVSSSLPNPEWLIVMTNDEINNVFENKNALLYGIIENEKLLSISGLFFDESDFLDIEKLCDIKGSKVAEIAECMTLPEARGNNYMLKINNSLLKKAKELGYEYLIATAHPDNTASNHSLQKLGMICKGQFYRYGKYFRNYYLIKI
ncbi:MAG: GNAT family N-acetyltransferase [Clostridia bacterium]|nr:GNAT family N-acetyltransferase [Clostridia bacterium]